jgi:hypothetical protein
MTTTISTRSAGTLNPTRQQLDELDALLQRMLELPVAQLDVAEPTETESAIEEPPAIELKTVRPAPVSYMVVETASPRPLPLASGFEPQPALRTPRLVPVTPLEQEQPSVSVPTTPPEPEVGIAPLTPTPRPPQGGEGLSSSPRPPQGGEGLGVRGESEDPLWVPLRSSWQPSPQTWPPLADSWHQANGATAPPVDPPTLSLEFTTPREVPVTPPAVEAEQPPAPQPPAVEPRLSLTAADAPSAGPRMLLPLVWVNQGFEACLSPLGAPGRWLCGPSGRQVLGFVGLTCLAAASAIAILAGLGCTW